MKNLKLLSLGTVAVFLMGFLLFSVGFTSNSVTEAVPGMGQADDNALVLVYSVTKSDNKVTLPLYGNVDCMVDWGDGGDAQKVTAKFPSHIYSKKGTYEVRVVGTVTSLRSNGIATKEEPSTNLIAVRQWGRTGLTDMANAFFYNTSLKTVPETDDAFKDVTSFAAAFSGCVALTDLPEGLFGDCPKCTDIHSIFNGCISLKEIPAKLLLTFTNVTNATGLFGLCTSLKTIPAGILDGFVSVTSFQNLFNGCSSLTAVPEGLFDKCTEVENMRNVFISCSSLKTVPVSIFDNCKKVTNFIYTFSGDTSLRGESPYTVIDGVKVHIYERAVAQGFAVPTEYTSCFGKCEGLDDYDSIPTAWGGGRR